MRLNLSLISASTVSSELKWCTKGVMSPSYSVRCWDPSRSLRKTGDEFVLAKRQDCEDRVEVADGRERHKRLPVESVVKVLVCGATKQPLRDWAAGEDFQHGDGGIPHAFVLELFDSDLVGASDTEKRTSTVIVAVLDHGDCGGFEDANGCRVEFGTE